MKSHEKNIFDARHLFPFVACLTCFALLFGCKARIETPPPSVNSNAAQSQKSALQDPSVASTPGQDAIELRQFSPDDLLREVRARERTSAIDFSDSVLERHTDATVHQKALSVIESNPKLDKYPSQVLVQSLIDQQKALYGEDNRKDVYQISSDPKIVASANAVVSLFHSSRIVPLDDNQNSKIVKKLYGTQFTLCDSEPFYAQPCSAYCSGVLVAPDIVATAGHCIFTPQKKAPYLEEIRFVFGYRMRNAEDPELIINNNEIYKGQRLLKQVYTQHGPDWALVKLDRPVVGHSPVSIRRTSKIKDFEDLYVIGHPCGLPAKFADGAVVRENANNDFFIANLDTYGGNSGSPVFNRNTHELEGILVRGEKDFVSLDPSAPSSCQVSLACPNTGCRGEDCVRTTIFADRVPSS